MAGDCACLEELVDASEDQLGVAPAIRVRVGLSLRLDPPDESLAGHGGTLVSAADGGFHGGFSAR